MRHFPPKARMTPLNFVESCDPWGTIAMPIFILEIEQVLLRLFPTAGLRLPCMRVSLLICSMATVAINEDGGYKRSHILDHRKAPNEITFDA